MVMCCLQGKFLLTYAFYYILIFKEKKNYLLKFLDKEAEYVLNKGVQMTLRLIIMMKGAFVEV